MSESAYSLATGILTGGLSTLDTLTEQKSDIIKKELDLTYNKKKLLQAYDPDVLAGKIYEKEQTALYENSPYYQNILATGEQLKNDLVRSKQDQSDRTFIKDPFNPEGPMIRKGDYYARESTKLEAKKEAYKISYEGSLGVTAGKRLSSDDNIDDKVYAVTYFNQPRSILLDNTYILPKEIKDKIRRRKVKETSYKKEMEGMANTRVKLKEEDLELERQFGSDVLNYVSAARQFTYGNEDPGFNAGEIQEDTYREGIMDAQEAALGMRRVNIKNTTINNLRKLKETNPLAPNINPRLPYLKFDTFKSIHAKSGKSASMTNEDITQYASDVFKQFSFFTDNILADMDDQANEEVKELLRNQMFIIQDSIGFKKGADNADVISHVRFENIGINLKSLPKQLRTVIEEATGQNIQIDEKVAKSAGSAVVKAKDIANNFESYNAFAESQTPSRPEEDIQITVNTQGVIDNLKETVFFESAGVPNADALVSSSSSKAFAIMNGVSLDSVTETNRNTQIASHFDGFIRSGNQKLQVIPNNQLMLPAAEFYFDVFYPSGNPGQMVKAEYLSGGNFERALDKGRKYSVLYASMSPEAEAANIPFDVFEYERTMGNLLALAISDEALLSQINKPVKKRFRSPSTNFLSPEDYVEKIAPKAYRDESQRAAIAGQNAERASNSYMANLNDYNDISGQVTEGITLLVDDMKKLGGQFVAITTGANLSSTTFEEATTGITNKINSMISSPTDDENKRKNVAGNKKLFNGILEREYDFSKEIIGGLSERKMLHAALTFYAAAAFQGEGGKAISDGDRKFVEWALSYGNFTDTNKRRFAISGLMKIISKATAVSEMVASGDPQRVYVGMNYQDLYGRNSLSPEDWPDSLKNEVDSTGQFIDWTQFVNTKNQVKQIPIDKPEELIAKPEEEKEIVNYGEQLERYLELLGNKQKTPQEQKEFDVFENNQDFMNQYNKEKSEAEKKVGI